MVLDMPYVLILLKGRKIADKMNGYSKRQKQICKKKSSRKNQEDYYMNGLVSTGNKISLHNIK